MKNSNEGLGDGSGAQRKAPAIAWLLLSLCSILLTTSACDSGSATSEDADALEPLPGAIELMGADAFPESVTFDPISRSFFVGSVGHGGITRIDQGGYESRFAAGQPGWITLGVEADPDRRRLWVCAAQGIEMTASEVWVFDLDAPDGATDARIGTYPLAGICNDIALGEDGSTFISDREAGQIHHVDHDDRTSGVWAAAPELEPTLIGLNGIVVSPRHLLVFHYMPSRLMRVDRTTLAVTEVELLGHDMAPIVGADGAVLLGERIYVVGDAGIAELEPLADDWSRASVRSATFAAEEPLSGFAGLTVAEGQLYASRGGMTHVAFGTTPSYPFSILRIETDPLGAVHAAHP